MKKTLRTIVITTSSGKFTLTDTEDCMVASMALESIQSGKGAYIEANDTLYWLPSGAVENIKITVSESEEIEPAEPVCP